MSIKSRMNKINQVAQAETTRLVYKRNKMHKVYHVDSVRTNKPYQVIFDWLNGSTLKCELYSFDHKEQNPKHLANFNGTVAYQALGAAKKIAREAGKILSLCDNEKDARKLLNFGGKLVKLVNLNGSIVWATVR